jgi:hypothetical protein
VSSEKFVELWALLLLGLFCGTVNKILVEFSNDRVEPSPIVRHRLENDSASVAPDRYFFVPKAKVFWKSHHVDPEPEQLSRDVSKVRPRVGLNCNEGCLTSRS